MQKEGVATKYIIVLNTIAGGCTVCEPANSREHLCCFLSKLHEKELHCYIIKREEYKDYLLLWNALVDIYARSGKVREARRLFDSLTIRDEISYTSMIVGYRMKGDGEAALKLLEEICEFEINDTKFTTSFGVLLLITLHLNWSIIIHIIIKFKYYFIISKTNRNLWDKE
ncbi:hypothetical protein L6164_031697 [Bauhinia variegata]|uniref:Uncharacterized protein n=1 Tax=Bauhinia variegata TaxID=167791 RepID=A0ACB9LGM8_BAUVA|nr:hypothetical protein L6164_031697 [Bauhinia variegata]